jgi:uncharacterized protein
VKLNNEFVVAAPMDRTWSTLLDLERVATCLPGATLSPSAGDGAYRGAMKVKLGPMVVAYDGVARLLDVDEDARTTTLEVQGKEARGQGTAAASIRSRLQSAGSGSTRVLVETDLTVTGRQAQFGRGIMEDVAGRMLGEFAARLETLILDGEGAASPGGAVQRPSQEAGSNGLGTGPAPAPRQDEEYLDVGSVVAGGLNRYAPVGGGLVAVLLVILAVLQRRRRGIRIKLDLRA